MEQMHKNNINKYQSGTAPMTNLKRWWRISPVQYQAISTNAGFIVIGSQVTKYQKSYFFINENAFQNGGHFCLGFNV